MPLNSMTGFARVEGAHGAVRWHWELRSVNGKGLDARLRLPAGLDGIEAKLRTELARHLKRGNCQINLVLERTGEAAPLRVNRAALQVVLEAIEDLQKNIEVMPPRPEAILALKGVLENAEDVAADEDAKSALEAALTASFAEGAKALAEARAQEGAKLEAVLTGHI
ncbi:MAG TPA: hypothetical protein DHK64_01285, partial [Rhodobiaceae bacterium]|nr:hypothetical protein [Rhodobiaceae bacterium]